MSMILGIAGEYCAGKSTVCGILAEKGFLEIDVDSLGHKARDAMSEKVMQSFGTLDRKEIGEIVFSSAEQLKKLESIVHPWMIAEVERQVNDIRTGGRNGVVNAALLYPMGLHRFCDTVIWVKAPVLIRFLRANRRDSAGLVPFIRRIRSQKKLYPQKDQKVVDIVNIVNAGNRARLERRVSEVLNNLQR